MGAAFRVASSHSTVPDRGKCGNWRPTAKVRVCSSLVRRESNQSNRSNGDFMNPSKAVLLFSVGLFCWSGCGSDSPCDKAASAAQSLANAISSCPAYFGGGGDGGTSIFIAYNKAACQSHLSSCSSSDQQALSNMFDCFSRIGHCMPGAELQFLGTLLQCVPPTNSISQACRTAFSL